MSQSSSRRAQSSSSSSASTPPPSGASSKASVSRVQSLSPSLLICLSVCLSVGLSVGLSVCLSSPSPPLPPPPPLSLSLSSRSVCVGCLTSQQHESVSQGRICSDNFTCCQTEIEVADLTLETKTCCREIQEYQLRQMRTHFAISF